MSLQQNTMFFPICLRLLRRWCLTRINIAKKKKKIKENALRHDQTTVLARTNLDRRQRVVRPL